MAKDLTITIAKKDIFYEDDYLSLAYVTASGGDNPERDDAAALDTEEAGEGRVFKRLCDHRMSDVKALLAKFLKPATSSQSHTENTTLDTGENWTLELSVSTEVDDSILQPMADSIHDYIVTGAAHDWYMHIGVNGNREALQNRAEAALARIRELIYTRPMPSVS